MDHPSDLYARLAELAAQCGAQKLVLFGSRARGDHRPSSDIDLAIYGMPEGSRSRFWAALEDLPTLLAFDLVHVSPATSQALLENIAKDGVTLMDKAKEKRDKLADSLARLEEAISEYTAVPSTVVRDGVIQRFEFCTELAWKAAREYLLDQGYTEINSPKSTMRQAYSDGLIADQDGWLRLLEDRNLTSHLYDDATAGEVFQRIQGHHLALFQALCQKLRG